MRNTILTLLFTIPLIGYFQIENKLGQGFVSNYNLYVDNIFDFQVKVHNSLIPTGLSSWYTKSFEDLNGYFLFEIEVDGIDVFVNRDPVPGSLIKYGDPRLVFPWNGGRDLFVQSYGEVLKSKNGVTYNLLEDDFYVVSGTSDDLIYYYKTILIDETYIVSVKLEYNVSKRELGSQICEQISNSFKTTSVVINEIFYDQNANETDCE